MFWTHAWKSSLYKPSLILSAHLMYCSVETSVFTLMWQKNDRNQQTPDQDQFDYLHRRKRKKQKGKRKREWGGGIKLERQSGNKVNKAVLCWCCAVRVSDKGRVTGMEKYIIYCDIFCLPVSPFSMQKCSVLCRLESSLLKPDFWLSAGCLVQSAAHSGQGPPT